MEHELHVAGAAGLLARGGDLLADFAGGHQLLRQRHPVVLQKDHLELILADRVVVDLLAERVDELDNLLGDVIPRRGLGPEQEGLGREVHVGIVTKLLVEIYNVQDVEQLALVLVQALDLDIKNRVGVQDDPRLLGHVVGKAALVLLLYHLQTVQDRPVLPALLQLAQRFRVE